MNADPDDGVPSTGPGEATSVTGGLTWTRSPAVPAGAAAALVLAALGVLLARVDVALLAVPLALSVAVAWDRRPDIQAPVTATARTSGVTTGGEVEYSIALQAAGGVDAAVLRLTVLGLDSSEVVVGPRTMTGVRGRLPVLHSGPQELVRAEFRLLGPDSALVSIPGPTLSVDRLVPPTQRAVRELPLPRRLSGLTGPHESARLGDGGEFRDIHPFAPGDRLRRVDWRTTARRGRVEGDLYVRRTSATADATVLIVMDSRDDVGEQISEWNVNVSLEKGLSALDVAREAAGSIAAGYIGFGDRVGFQDLSSRARMVAHGGGHRHLWRVLRAIENTAPESVPFHRRRPPIVPPGALVFVLSSFLDEPPIELAARWRGAGHRVIAVDVLPAARFARTTPQQRLAHRIVMLEQRDRLHRLGARGVEVLRWPDDDPTLPLAGRLRLLARARSRRR